MDFDSFSRDGMYDRYLNNIKTNSNSIVFDLGSYKGSSLLRLASKCQGTIYGFEPIPLFYEEALRIISHEQRIRIFNCAVSDTDGQMTLHMNHDETSITKTSGQPIQCQVRSFVTIWKHLGIQTLDVLHMNIEGGEYDVIRNIMKHDLLKHIKTLVIQFHYPSEETRSFRSMFHAELLKTHTCVYDYAFVWERWSLREE